MTTRIKTLLQNSVSKFCQYGLIKLVEALGAEGTTAVPAGHVLKVFKTL